MNTLEALLAITIMICLVGTMINVHTQAKQIIDDSIKQKIDRGFNEGKKEQLNALGEGRSQNESMQYKRWFIV